MTSQHLLIGCANYQKTPRKSMKTQPFGCDSGKISKMAAPKKQPEIGSFSSPTASRRSPSVELPLVDYSRFAALDFPLPSDRPNQKQVWSMSLASYGLLHIDFPQSI
jgi:hypothetical protein